MSEPLDTPLNSRELSRLELAVLVQYGEQALKAGLYRRAASLLREAVRRAPFRQDLRELMAAAIEGASSEPGGSIGSVGSSAGRSPRDSYIEEVREPEPQSQSNVGSGRSDLLRSQPRGVRPRRVEAPPEFFGEPGPVPVPPPETERPRPERVVYEREPASPAPPPRSFERPAAPLPRREEPPQRQAAPNRPIVFGRGPSGHRIEPVRRGGTPKPAQFTKRHNRGPVSALLLTIVVGLVFLSAAAGGIYWYMQKVAEPATESASPTQRYESEYELANTYQNNRQFSQAVEVLQKLPETPRRNHMLAKIFIAQADVSLQMKPPALESALESIKQAVNYERENAEYGLLLGEVYYTLGCARPSGSPESKTNLENARKAYEEVTRLHPDNLKGWLRLGDVAGKINDHNLQASCYDKIIKIDPSSEEADTARRNMRSLNYRN